MASLLQVHEIVFPENCVIYTISRTTSNTTIKLVNQELKCEINC